MPAGGSGLSERAATNALAQSSVMGVLCTCVGVLVGAGFMGAPGEGWQWFPLLAGLAAFASGTLCWWVLVARSSRSGIWRGVLAGVAAALLAHYVTFYLLIVKQNIAYWGYGTVSSLGEPPVDLAGGIVGAVAFTLFSYLLVGWLTIPAGAVIGGVYARYLNRR